MKSIPVTISYPSTTAALSLHFVYNDDEITFINDNSSEIELDYIISNINTPNNNTTLSGITTGNINISSLPNGIYVIKAIDKKSGEIYVNKFVK